MYVTDHYTHNNSFLSSYLIVLKTQETCEWLLYQAHYSFFFFLTEMIFDQFPDDKKNKPLKKD